MSISEFKNVVWKEGDSYVAQSLNVDFSNFGDSKAGAVANLREALELYLEDTAALSAQTIEEVEGVAAWPILAQFSSKQIVRALEKRGFIFISTW